MALPTGSAGLHKMLLSAGYRLLEYDCDTSASRLSSQQRLQKTLASDRAGYQRRQVACMPCRLPYITSLTSGNFRKKYPKGQEITVTNTMVYNQPESKSHWGTSVLLFQVLPSSVNSTG